LERDKFAYQKAQDAEEAAKIAKNPVKGSNYKNAKKTANKQADTSAHRSTLKDRQINRKLENDKKNPPIDTNSVMALGFGPISASTIRNMEKQGMVERYIEDGKVKFRKNVKLRRR
jgi:hypothetical protein